MAESRRRAVVHQIIDGDTLDTSAGTIRLANVVARELDEPGGKADREKLAALLKEGDEVRFVEVARDRYRRRIARVYKGQESVNNKLGG